jgi:hypothetical protein
MATINIDNVEYDLEQLNDNARAQLSSIRTVDQKLSELQAETAILQTARQAYAAALKAELPTIDEA